MPWSTWKRLVQNKNGSFFLPAVNAYLLLTSLKVCDWSGDIFGASARPRSLTKKTGCHPLPLTVHGGQHDTKYVTFELLMHAALNRGWRSLGFTLEPARIEVSILFPPRLYHVPLALVITTEVVFVFNSAWFSSYKPTSKLTNFLARTMYYAVCQLARTYPTDSAKGCTGEKARQYH